MTLVVSDLTVHFTRRREAPPLVENVGFSLEPGTALGIVGETGAGKTLTARALLGLMPDGIAARGSVDFGGGVQIDLSAQRAVRQRGGRNTAIVLQNPAAMFDPLLRVGPQLLESTLHHRLMPRKVAEERMLGLLRRVGFEDATAATRLYPHQLSGGMAQRMAIAMALMPRPQLLIADEPTSALDAHLRVEALKLLRQASGAEGAATIIISHDLGLVRHFCDDILVMYGGRVMERGPTAAVLARPEHPYTRALLQCSVSLSRPAKTPLGTIEGAPPDVSTLPPGCVFAARCPAVTDVCRRERPALRGRDGRAAACHFAFQVDRD